MAFVFLLPCGLLFLTITFIFKSYFDSDFLTYIGFAGVVMIIFGALFFVLHMIAIFFEGSSNTSESELGKDILDEEMLE